MSAGPRPGPGQTRARERSDSARNKWRRFKSAARAGSVEALKNLVHLSTHAEKEADQIRAGGIVMAYAWGSPSAEPEPLAEVVDMHTKTPRERIALLQKAIEAEEANLAQKETA